MAWPLVRIDLGERSRDFQRSALQPGFPVLDRFGTNGSVMRKWLGRYVADAQWDEQAVRFLWCDDDNVPPTAIASASQKDLHGVLKSEVEGVQEKLAQAVPKSPNERVLLEILKQRFERAVEGDPKESGTLFKVQSRGRWHLIWCWGYDRRHATSAPVRICSRETCRLAFCDDPQTRHQCPRCRKKLRRHGMVPASAILALILGLIGGLGYVAWDAAGRPGFVKSNVSVEGVVVDAINGNAIPSAFVELASDAKQLKQSNQQGEFQFPFTGGRPERLRISAPGYVSASWDPAGGPIPQGPQRIGLRGESDVTGVIVEQGTDRPVPFPIVRAIRSGHQGTADEHGMFLIGGVPGGAADFEVTARGYQTEQVSLELKPGRSSDLLVSLKGAATVTGIVLDAFNKQPIARSTVKVLDLPGESTTDDKGTFRRDELPGTTCRFEVAAPGFYTREFERQLAPKGESTLRFLLRPELTVLEGMVVDSAGGVVPSAKVRMVDTEAPATTTSEGLFRFANVRKGTRQLDVSADGYPTRTVDVAIPLLANDPVRIVLTGLATLSGRVVDAVRKSAVEGAEVQLDNGRWKTTTDQQGMFEIAGLPSGPVSLNVTGRGYRLEQSESTLTADGSKVEIELHGTTVLSGTVLSAFDKRPLVGAKVELEGLPQPQMTDGEGRFRFEGVVACPARLHIIADNYQPAKVECETTNDQETNIQSSLRGGAKLMGKVVADQSNQPIPFAEVTVAGTDRKLITNEKGEFSQEDWPTKPIRLKVSAKGFSAQELDHDFVADSAAPISIHLKPPHVVNGIVVDARNGKPVGGAQVKLAGLDDSIVSDGEGRFRFETPLVKLYEFGVAANGYPPQSFVEHQEAMKSSAQNSPEANSSSETTEQIGQLPFRLALKRDADDPSPPDVSAIPTRSSKSTSPLTDPAPSAADQFGPPRTKPRDPLEVDFFGIRVKAANVGFAVDSSGSMAGNRLQRTKLELLKSVLDLHPKQMYYVAFFNDQPHLMFDGEKSPVIASPVNKARTYKWIKTVNSGGGTDPQATLEMLAKMDPKAIFLLSDGVFSPLSEPLYEELKQKKISVNSIAFEDKSGQEGLKTIAERTLGKFRFVPQAPIPDLYEISLVTRLYEELLEQWCDPNAAADDARDAHEGLMELSDGQDFGPTGNPSETERRKARDEWRRWWVENKLTPQILPYDEARLLANLGSQDPLWRWASLEALIQKDYKNAGVFIRKIRDTEGGIRQASRRALMRLAGEDDYGPAVDANHQSIRDAFEKWTEWSRRLKYIGGLKTKSDDSLIHDFEHPDPKTRRAAVQAAADRTTFSQPLQLIERLTDPDHDVRQSAYAALVKNAGKDLGPGDCSDLSRCEAATKLWRKWTTEKIDADAEKLLQFAESLESNNRSDAAQAWYRRLIERFPNTEGAAKAAAKLKAAP